MAEEFTAKFKVDVSDLKKGITEANKQIKLANATFKAETAGMDNWSKNADGLSKKLKNLKDVLENQKKVLESYKQQLERQKAAYDENGKRAEELKAKLKQLAQDGVAKTDDEYKKYERALKNVQKEQENNGKACDDLRLQILNQQGAVNKAEADIKKYDTALSDLEKEEKKAAEEAKRQKTAYEQLTDTVDKQETELKDLKQKYSEVVLEQGKDSQAAKDLKQDISKLSSELKDNKARLNDADRAADELDDSFEDAGKGAEQANSGFTAMKAALGDLVSQAIQAAINALKDLAKEAYNAWEAFDQGADNITALTGKTGAEAEDMMNAYKNLGKTINGEFSDIGTAVGEVSTRFDLTGEELENVAGQFLKFADINKTDVKTSIDNVQSAMAAFGVSSDETTAFLDALNKAGQESGTSVDQLSSQLVSNSEALQELGFNASDSIKLLSSFSKNGIDSSTAMAGLKKALQNATKSGKPLDTTMQRMYNSIAKAGTETQALQRATDLFGAKAAPALTAAIRDGRLSFDQLGTSLTDAEGNIDKTYETMRSGQDKIALAMQDMKMRTAELFGELLDKYSPEIEEFLGKLTTEILPKVFEALDWLMDHLPEIIGFIDKVADASPIQALCNSIALIPSAWENVKTAFASAPQWFSDKVITPVKKFFTDLWDKIKRAGSNAWTWIKNTWQGAKDWFNNTVIVPVKNFFSGMWDKLSQGASDAWTAIKNVFSNVTTWFRDKFSEAWRAVKNVFSTGGEIFGEITEGITAAFKRIVNRIIGGLNTVISIPFNAINRALDRIRNVSILGVRPFSGIGSVSVPQIPLLAQGGVLKKGQVGLLEGSGAEAVVPLDRNKRWVRAIAGEMLKQLSPNNVTNSSSSIKNLNTSFVQNIYANEAPSRLELYRQTKNLLNLAKGGIV